MPIDVVDNLTGISQHMTYETTLGGGLGQVSQVDETRPEGTYTVSYSYTEAGERSVATYATPNGTRKWQYGDYIKVGPPEGGSRVFQTLTKLVPSGTDWIASSEEFHYQFDAQGRLLEAAFAQTPQAGQTGYGTAQTPVLAGHRARASYVYDPGGRTLELAHFWDDLDNGAYLETPVLGSINQYDAVLGLKTDVDFKQKAPSSNTWVSYAKQQYTYDAQLDYLTSAKYDDDGNGTWDATHTWSYDAAGNRATASAQPGTWSYDNLNRMTASPMGVYENDLLGNRIWQNRYVQNAIARKMEWDVLNRMTSACTQSAGARYEYRADGMRTLKVEGLSLVWQNLSEEEQEEEGSGFYDAVWATNKPTTRFFYDGQMPIEDDFTRLVNNVMTVDVTRNGLGARGIDIIEKTTSGGTTTAFPLYDGHGNMVATLSRAGTGFAVNDRRSFDAWGIVRSGATTGDPKGRYVANLGHVQDDESGLVYMRARYYEALSGRFVSEDPAKDGLNWHVYCLNQPVTSIDATGKDRIQTTTLWMVGFFLTSAAIVLAMDNRDVRSTLFAMTAARYAVLAFAGAMNGLSVLDNYYSPLGSTLLGIGLGVLYERLVASCIVGLKAGAVSNYGMLVVGLVFAYSLVLLGTMVASDWD